MSKKYLEKTFKTNKQAWAYSEMLKNTLGYQPSVFQVTHPRTRKSKFVVVKPR